MKIIEFTVWTAIIFGFGFLFYSVAFGSPLDAIRGQTDDFLSCSDGMWQLAAGTKDSLALCSSSRDCRDLGAGDWQSFDGGCPDGQYCCVDLSEKDEVLDTTIQPAELIVTHNGQRLSHEESKVVQANSPGSIVIECESTFQVSTYSRVVGEGVPSHDELMNCPHTIQLSEILGPLEPGKEISVGIRMFVSGRTKMFYTTTGEEPVELAQFTFPLE